MMKLIEVFLGTAKEKAAQQAVKRLGSLNRLRPAQQQEKAEAETLTRRLMLRRVFLGGSVVIASGAAIPLLISYSKTEEESLRVRQPFKAAGFENWTAYFNQDLPASSVLPMAEDLINAPEYTGFPQAGQLLKTAVTNYANLDQFNPRLTNPVRVILRPMKGAIAGFFINTSGVGKEAKITNRKNGQTFDVVFLEPNKHLAEIDLEQTMAFGSNAVKALMIVKEISHLAHMADLRELIYNEFDANFTLNAKSSLPVPDLLLYNGFFQTRLNIDPPLSNNFYNAKILLDWAGYWHITPALGRMLRQGVLTQQDKEALVSGGNIPAFNTALQRGLIREQRPGVYIWREGAGPFSQEWQGIMRSIPQVPQMQN